MTDKIKAAGQLLTASTNERVLSYLLLPFGETGRTSAGAITASAGSVTIPDAITANMEHDPTRPVARSIRLEETERGLEAAFRIAATTAGNDLLIEAAEGLRTGISVEIDNPVIRAGALLAGDLVGAGFVTTPAFPSAQLVAHDCGDIEESEDNQSEETPESEADATDATTTEEESPVDNDSAQTAELLVASRNGATNKDKAINLSAASKLIASTFANGDVRSLQAALTDIPSGGVGGIYEDTTPPTWLGELWSGRTFQQRFAPLVSRQTLSGKKFYGWRFTETPTVDDWAGFPNPVPTSDVDTETVTGTAAKLAGGWVIDRDFADYSNSQFIESFLRHATDDYARKIDAKVLAKIVASATTLPGVTPVAGVGTASQLIVEGALEMIGDDASMLPEFALVGRDIYKELVYTQEDNGLKYLSSAIGLDGGTLAGFQVIPVTDPALDGNVIVGNRAAVTLFELPGSPVRVDALDVARGGIELGLYGYYGLLHSGKGLVRVALSEA